MAVALRYAARSDIGLGRYSNNQDSGYAGPHLLAVCDGMGGHAAGDVASSVAMSRLSHLDGEPPRGDAMDQLEATLRSANADLRQRTLDEPNLRGMGTTATVLLLDGQRFALAHIGDSRCYLLRDGELVRLTHDHTFVQRLVDEGRITEEEAEHHPQRSVITRVLTGDPDDEPDLSVREARIGDRYVLCSDGLTGVVSDSTLAEVLGEHDDPARAAQALVDLALRGGGADNITVIVGHVVDPADASGASVPEVVGSAAVHGTVPTAADERTPAAKAAALDRPAADDEGDVDPTAPGPPPSRRRWTLRVLATVLVLAVLSLGGYGAYAWSQQQYFVGADGDDVAIFRGLPQDVGPISMSHVYERQDLALSTLPEYTAEQVRGAITVDDLAAARSKVDELRTEACPTATPAATGSPTTTSPTTPASGTATTSASSGPGTASASTGAAGAAASRTTSPSPTPSGTTTTSPGPTTSPSTTGGC